MYRAALFDLDGTLIDGFPAIAASVNHVRSLYGLPDISVAEVKRHVGRGPAYLLAHAVGAGDPQENLAAYWIHHLTVMRDRTELLPGAREALEVLRRKGMKLGVCSNKPIDFTRDIVAYLGIAGLLDVVLGPEDTGTFKPAPDVVHLAMERLGVKAAETVFVGDMRLDIETARNAGVAAWVVPTGTQSADELAAGKPDRVFVGLRELAEAA
jgi:phosphoglycolate phosphatase